MPGHLAGLSPAPRNQRKAPDSARFLLVPAPGELAMGQAQGQATAR
jgi:hypothetical protein